jgi:2-keto-4-pentenoate hydratase
VRAGTVVLTGGVCAAHPAPPGSAFAADFGALGTATCSFH